MKDNCNLTTCRYNENGKCTNEEKRKEKRVRGSKQISFMFGKDANVAVKKCADDGFRNYVTIDELNKCEQKSNIDLGMRIALIGVKEQISVITEELSRKGIDTPKGFSVLSGYVQDRIKELD